MFQHPDPPDTAAGPLLLTVEQAADRLGIGRTLAYALVSADEIESVHIGRLRRIPADALPAFVNRLRGITADRPAA
jgi:excisionase family DNA binding protein